MYYYQIPHTIPGDKSPICHKLNQERNKPCHPSCNPPPPEPMEPNPKVRKPLPRGKNPPSTPPLTALHPTAPSCSSVRIPVCSRKFAPNTSRRISRRPPPKKSWSTK